MFSAVSVSVIVNVVDVDADGMPEVGTPEDVMPESVLSLSLLSLFEVLLLQEKSYVSGQPPL